MIRQTTISITVEDTVAAEGAETQAGTSSAPLNGRLEAIYVNHGTGAGTTDLTITCGSPAIPILTKADSTTDAWFYPRAALALNTDGSALSFYDKIPLNGYVTATIAQANKNQTCAVTVFWDDGR
jgi:hypothetical protein